MPVQNMLKTRSFEQLELSDLIDAKMFQEMMDDYYALTGIGIGIIDLKGNVLVGTGWQDICVNFHRKNPESLAYCLESDILLSSDVAPGTFKTYKCKNNMWDMVTPIMLGERHIGNIFLGQFLYDDEEPDYELFRQQAKQFGFDEEAYLAALDKVPRWSRETLEHAMRFYSKLAQSISQTNYACLQQDETLQTQQHMYEAIHQAKHEWEDTFDAVPDLISIIDINHRIMQVNKAMAQHCGKSRKELIGRHCFELIHGCQAPPEYCPHMKMIQHGSTQRVDVEEERFNKIFEVCASPLFDNTGKIRACVHISRDITQRKKAEQEREKLEEQLRHAQRMQSIGTLASGIAHDFNNIITAIIGYTHINQMSIPPESQLQANLQQILDACNRASHLTRDLLLFSRKQPVNKKLINLHKVISKSEMFLSRIIGDNIKLNITTEHGNELFIHGDEQQLGQVFMNLSTNSRDAMPDGGAIFIDLAEINLTEHESVAIGLAKPGKYASIIFSDTGNGIDPEKIHNIFDPFYTTKEPGKGTGLGLSIVYGIIKNHEGAIKAESSASSRTTITIYLPLALREIAS